MGSSPAFGTRTIIGSRGTYVDLPLNNGVQAANWWIAPVLPRVKEREDWWVTYWEEREAVGDYEELDGIN